MPLSALERALCDRVASRRDALIEQLAAHVALPTGGNHRPGLDAYRSILADRLGALGAEIEVEAGDPRPEWLRTPAEPADSAAAPPPVLIARRPARGARVLLAGHLDTVHAPDGAFRTMTMEASNRTAIGPGVVDMKGGVLIAVTALEVLAEAGVDVHWTFLLNSDEETGSFCSERMLQREARRHDFGLVVEPALPGGALAIARMGSGQFAIEVFGRSAHVGRDFAQGVSAVRELARIVLHLSDLAAPQDGVIVNIGPLQGGLVTNAVADHAACWGNVRFADEAAGRELGRRIDALATEGMPRVVVHRNWNRPAKPQTPQVTELAELARSAAADLGQGLPFATTGGVCDGNSLQHVGLPTIDTLGVRGGNLHRPDEFIELASLIERCQLLTVLLRRLSGGAR